MAKQKAVSEWQRDFQHLKNLKDHGRCCMKFQAPGENRYSKFGVVYGGGTIVYLISIKTGMGTGEAEHFTSLEHMLNAGWRVD